MLPTRKRDKSTAPSNCTLFTMDYHYFNLSSDGTNWRFETFYSLRHCSGYTWFSYAILFHKFVQ